jgi:predicted GIY-YIG superfamily endonuclease
VTDVPHYFYLARCADGALYAGSCVDLAAREARHNRGTGAKYTRSRRPVAVVYHEEFETLSAARKREAEVKRWAKPQKESLVQRPQVRRRGRRKPPLDPVAFVAHEGVVLASAKGPVPNIAEAVAGQPIRGSWWSHEKGRAIFRALSLVSESPDVLCFRLVAGKISFVHRRLWPALVRLADLLGRDRLAAIRQEHTPSGAHRNVVTPFPKWVPPDVRRAAAALREDEARELLRSMGGALRAASAPCPRGLPRRRRGDPADRPRKR